MSEGWNEDEIMQSIEEINKQARDLENAKDEDIENIM